MNPGNGGEGSGSTDDIATHNMLIKGDNIDTHADPEPQITLDQWISGPVVEGAPTEEPRPDASNARSEESTSACLRRKKWPHRKKNLKGVCLTR